MEHYETQGPQSIKMKVKLRKETLASVWKVLNVTESLSLVEVI